MSDTKINIEVVCERHPTVKLEVVSEHGSNFYDFKLNVTACSECLANAINNADLADFPARPIELVLMSLSALRRQLRYDD